jgi:hypothetical protein
MLESLVIPDQGDNCCKYDFFLRERSSEPDSVDSVGSPFFSVVAVSSVVPVRVGWDCSRGNRVSGRRKNIMRKLTPMTIEQSWKSVYFFKEITQKCQRHPKAVITKPEIIAPIALPPEMKQVYIPIHFPRSWRKKSCCTTAAGRASPAAEKNAFRILPPSTLLNDVALALQIDVRKRPIDAHRKVGLVPKNIAQGIQKKFYSQCYWRGSYSKAKSENTPIDGAVDGVLKILPKLVHNEDKSRANARHNPRSKPRKDGDREISSTTFPIRPIERIIRIVRRLGDKHNVIPLLEAMFLYKLVRN